MSRPQRFSYAHALHHVTLRCNNREFLFSVRSCELFVAILQEARGAFNLELYNYCLMTNHVHLLFSVGRDDALSRAMHWISSTFSHRSSKLAGRHGHLWEGRFRSTIVDANAYFLRCMAYVDLNPVRAKMVVTPLEYRWPGHRALRDEDTAVLDLHPRYVASGADARSRYSAYTRFLADEAKRAPFSLATKYLVGSPRFVAGMEKKFALDEKGAWLTRETLCADDMSPVISTGPRLGGMIEPH